MNKEIKRPEVAGTTSSLDKYKPYKLSIPAHITFKSTRRKFAEASRNIISQSSIGGAYDTHIL
jgi:hypothetical protein